MIAHQSPFLDVFQVCPGSEDVGNNVKMSRATSGTNYEFETIPMILFNDHELTALVEIEKP